MPDIPTLTAQIVALLAVAAPLLSSIATGAAEHVGAEGIELGKRLLARLRQRVRGNPSAERALEGFTEDPDTFREALARSLASVLQEHPEFAQEMADLLAEAPSQRILARNRSVVEEVQMSISSGSGEQIINADNSQVRKVKMSQK